MANSQSTTSRAAPISLKLASLPPLIMSPYMNEKDLPCIMITPSSPVRERDFQLHQYEPEKLQPGFLSHVRHAFWMPSDTSLQTQLESYPYGQSAHSGWSASKRFRVLLMLAACLFFALHLFVLPKAENGGFHFPGSGHLGSSDWEEWTDGSVVSVEIPSTTMPAATVDEIISASML